LVPAYAYTYTRPELERGIKFYRASLAQYFPFVVLADQVNVDEFYEVRPFCSLVMAMLGCTKNRVRQRILAVECGRYLGTHVMQNGAKSLDILQGLLILVHWYVHVSDPRHQ
jgi:hypothetical protein